jgi:S-adenosyl methyltransferase
VSEADSARTRILQAGLDVTKPNVARVYDYFAGGKDNFAADREFADAITRFAPKSPYAVRHNREFLRRVVRFLAGEAGITQFLDIGSGLPTAGNVSEVAHEVNPDAHIVHVDNDPVVYTHSQALLADSRTTDFVLADARQPAEILADPAVAKLIDFTRPVGLVMIAVLHHISDDDAPGTIADRLRAAMPPGSYLAISSFRMPGPEFAELRAVTREGEKLLEGQLGSGRWREQEEILTWFGDWELLEPGLVSVVDWRPLISTCSGSRDPVYQSLAGGVARKVAERLSPCAKRAAASRPALACVTEAFAP